MPPDDPIHDADDDEMLRQEIRNQMSPCHVILILAGVYATYSRWINEEIDLAESGFFFRAGRPSWRSSLGGRSGLQFESRMQLIESLGGTPRASSAPSGKWASDGLRASGAV